MNDNSFTHYFIKYDCVLFDLDGILVDLCVEWSDVRRDMQYIISSKMKKFILPRSFSRLIEYAQENGFLEVRRFVADVLNYHESNASFTKISEMVNLFTFLHGKKHLGIVTNNLHSTAERIIDELKIERDGIVIIGFDDVNNSKPHPEGILEAVSCFPSCKKVVFVGNRESDGKAAEDAGVDFFKYDKEENKLILHESLK